MKKHSGSQTHKLHFPFKGVEYNRFLLFKVADLILYGRKHNCRATEDFFAVKKTC
jgi:hypothetical protein